MKEKVVFDLDGTLVMHRLAPGEPIRVRPGAIELVDRLSGVASLVLWTGSSLGHVEKVFRACPQLNRFDEVYAVDHLPQLPAVEAVGVDVYIRMEGIVPGGLCGKLPLLVDSRILVDDFWGCEQVAEEFGFTWIDSSSVEGEPPDEWARRVATAVLGIIS